MIKNYIKIAIRNLRKHTFISFINLFGLTLGMTSCLLILAYYIDESQYDKHHKNSDRIHRVTFKLTWPGGNISSASSSGMVAPLLKRNFPEIESTARFFAEGNEAVKVPGGTLSVSPIFTEQSFFQVFDHPFLYGNSNTALTDPYSLVITETLANKLFGNAALALGKMVEYLNRQPQKITGVIRDIPRQSHFYFDAIGVLDTRADFVNTFQAYNVYTYILLKQGADPERLASKISQFLQTNKQDIKGDLQLPLQRLTSIHLYSHLENELQANGNILYLYIFFLVAGIILLLACINYINLATAQSMKRAKEVGIRKVMGSARWQLIIQFFTESFLLVVCALLLSLVLMELVSPVIQKIAGRDISIWQNGSPFVVVLMLLIAMGVGLVSGIYPALFLSHFKPIAVLKGVFGSQPSNILFRRSLVVFQFTISTALIVFSWIVYQQLNFAMQKDLGFTKEQVVGLRISSIELRLKNLSLIKSRLELGPGIAGSTATT
ncbi:MAG: ABC transporter permease, partial [Chitinophagaceae bacterium]